MVELSQLWLPIVVSAIAVFFVSFCMWMVLPHHKSDWLPVPDEDGLMDHLRGQGLSGGQYSLPHCADPALMKDEKWMARYNRGPKGYLLLLPEGPLNMGLKMCISFVFNLITALMVAYVASMVLPIATSGGLVFRFTLTVAFLANAFGLVWGSVWFGRTWSSTLKEMFDGLMYALATALAFTFLWPSA